MPSSHTDAALARDAHFKARLAQIEQAAGGRLGVAVAHLSLPIRENHVPIKLPVMISQRGDERFAFCSSFKLSLAALVLAGSYTGEWSLDEAITYSKADLLPNSPATAGQVSKGSETMGNLAMAVQLLSDNTAANLLLRRIGGPERLNRFWRALGDDHSRLDDFEPALNRVPAGSVRNTTTPDAMAQTLGKLFVVGLGGLARSDLRDWMTFTQTGAKRIRAGLPRNWWAGDKTGTGLPEEIPGTYVDLCLVTPEGPPSHPWQPTFAIAAFYQPARPTPEGDPKAEAVLADVGRAFFKWWVL